MSKREMGYIYQFSLLGLVAICIGMDFIYTKKLNEILVGAVIGLMSGINVEKKKEV